jgi:hypothetical protein
MFFHLESHFLSSSRVVFKVGGSRGRREGEKVLGERSRKSIVHREKDIKIPP